MTWDEGLRDLGTGLAGSVVLPGDEGWEAARQAWNLAVDQRPVAVVYPESADDVVATVRFAAERGIRIAFNAGGHNAGPIDWSRDTLLLKTERMSGIADRRHRATRTRRGGCLAKPLADRGRRARPRLPRRHVARRRRPRLCARRRASAGWSARTASPATASSRPRSSPPTGGSSAPTATRSPSCSGRSAGGRERRRGDRHRARALPDRRDLRRRPVLADRARGRDPRRLARLDRDRAR